MTKPQLSRIMNDLRGPKAVAVDASDIFWYPLESRLR
jgi:hypothetical protein